MVALSGAGAQALPLRYHDLGDRVLAKNGHALSARFEEEAARDRTGHFLRSVLPRLELQYGAEQFRTGYFPVLSQPVGAARLTLNLFKGGTDRLEDSIRERQLQISGSEARSAEMEELTKARRAFWSIVYLTEMERVLSTARSMNSESLGHAKRKHSAGIGTETDLLDFRIQETNLDQDLSRVRIERRILERELNALIGEAVDAELIIDERLPHEHEEPLLRETAELTGHRDVVALRAREDSADLRSSIEKRWWLPRIDVFGVTELYSFRERSFTTLRDRTDLAFGLKLTLQVFDGGGALSESSASGHEREAWFQKKGQSLREIEAEYAGARDRLRLTHGLIDGAEENVKLAERYLKSSLSEYLRGLKNSPDLIGANLRFQDARRRLLELKKDYQLAKADLLRILGN